MEETEGGSESDAGRRGGKSKRKTGRPTKARVSAIAEEEDETAAGEAVVEDVAMQEEPLQEPAQDPPKKRGRPPKSSAAKPAASSKGKKAVMEEDVEDVAEIDDEPVPRAPAKRTHTRTRSKANIESEAETAQSSSKRTHTRTKSGSKAKVKEDEEEPVVSAPPPKKKKKGKQAAAKTEDEEEEEPASAPPKKPKSRGVTKSKSKLELPPSDTEDIVPEPVAEDEPHAKIESGRDTASRGPKPSHESKSSLSEDAGYATAEPPPDTDLMDVDDPIPLSPPPVKTQPAVPTNGASRARTVSRSTPADSDTGKRPSPAENGVRSSSVASSSMPSTARPSSKLNKDALQVIEIDSEGEETGVHGPPPKAAVKGKAPMSRTASTSSANGIAKKPASQASKRKLQVEVLDPPPPARAQTMEVETTDVQMHEQSSTSPVRTHPARGATPSVTKELEPPGPGTPVSAVHRSAVPSPVREGDVAGSSPDTEVLGTVPTSPRTYHPFLAQMPIEKLTRLTEEETDMTLEQYIRREMEIQLAQLKADGERRIDEFKQKAADAKKLIESS